ncbi:MAG: Fic family protein [Thermonemataceae bacterium]|nr:Fic family protein [Thermonemataceae bacterium]
METKKLKYLIDSYQKMSENLIDYEKYNYYALTHHSTALEGSTLTENQVINLLEYGKTSNKPFEELLMVSDHFKALSFVIETANLKKELSPIFIQEVNEKVMKNTGSVIRTILGEYDSSKGHFRLSMVRAGTRTFPDFKKVPDLVKKFCKETNQGLLNAKSLEEKCKVAFKAHFDLVSIHPFADGNGRTSRLIMNYIQAYFGLPLSVVFKKDRIHYIDALEEARKKEDINFFYDFMFNQYILFLKKEIAQLRK